MSEEDWWAKWFRRKANPFFYRSGFRDMDEFFRDIEEMMEREFGELSKRAPRELVRERTLPDGTKVKRWGPFVYGYSVTVGSDGKPQVREFGNMKPQTHRGKPQVNIREEREPLVDVLEADGEIRIVAELPGVEKKDIKLYGSEKDITISVNTPQRKYHKKVSMLASIDPKQAKSKYNNGVLEITLPKKKEQKPKGERIEID